MHPRRNDRFLNASGLLHAIYRDVDFTNFHFTGHLLNALAQASPKKFALVREELMETWVARMQSILDRIDGPVVFLWMGNHPPGADSKPLPVHSAPMFVDREMIDRLSGQIIGTVEVLATEEEILAGHDRMIFTALEELVAREMMGPIVHEAVARKLQAVMPRLH